MRSALITALLAALLASPAFAKLPPPSDEAKAKAADAAVKSAWGGKVAGFQLCKSMDKAAAGYFASMKAAGKETKPPTETLACADPGPFVASPAAAPAPAPAAAPAAAAPAKKS